MGLNTSFLNNLSYTPLSPFGFGFQTEKNQKDTEKLYNKVTEDVIRDAKKINPHIDKSAFENFRSDNAEKSIKSAIKIANIVNALGYFPFIGRIIGAARILAAICTPLNDKQKAAHMIRGVSELTGYNRIRFVVDVIATLFNLRNALNASSRIGHYTRLNTHSN